MAYKFSQLLELRKSPEDRWETTTSWTKDVARRFTRSVDGNRGCPENSWSLKTGTPCKDVSVPLGRRHGGEVSKSGIHLGCGGRWCRSGKWCIGDDGRRHGWQDRVGSRGKPSMILHLGAIHQFLKTRAAADLVPARRPNVEFRLPTRKIYKC